MIYVTGDCHQDFRRFSMECFPEQREMTKEDIVIILGDFGGVWNYRGEDKEENYWLNWLNDKKFTTLFVDGNHECFPRLNKYPERDFCGGRVHEIRPSVLHLMRGELFELEGKKFFAFGGASSHDVEDGILDPVKDKGKIKRWRYDREKRFRVDGVNWWREELPSETEMSRGRTVLAENENKVDFVLSHAAPQSVAEILIENSQKEEYSGLADNKEKNIQEKNIQSDKLTVYFDQLIQEGLKFDLWFFGHYHKNQRCGEKFICLYEQIIQII